MERSLSLEEQAELARSNKKVKNVNHAGVVKAKARGLHLLASLGAKAAKMLHSEISLWVKYQVHTRRHFVFKSSWMTIPSWMTKWKLLGKVW